MYAVAFDLHVATTRRSHPRSVRQGYLDVEATLSQFGFSRAQGSLFVTEDENMANLFEAMTALKKLSWFAECVRDIRAFRIEQWSDFTPTMKR